MKHQNNATLSEKTIIYQTTFEKLKQMKRVLGDRSICKVGIDKRE